MLTGCVLFLLYLTFWGFPLEPHTCKSVFLSNQFFKKDQELDAVLWTAGTSMKTEIATSCLIAPHVWLLRSMRLKLNSHEDMCFAFKQLFQEVFFVLTAL